LNGDFGDAPATKSGDVPVTTVQKSIDQPPHGVRAAEEMTRKTESLLLDRARELAPILQKRASEAECQRRIPDETDREFREAGFYRVLQPAAFGGLELSYGIHMELAAEIARGCPSSAWVLGVIASHAWILGMFPPEAQREFWAKDPRATLASSFFPDGASVTREASGFRLRGRWKFSSGVDLCQGVILMAMAAPSEGSGPPSAYFLLVPQNDYRVEDTWFSAGLIATGSNDVVIENAFVPEFRGLEVMQPRNGKSPGGVFHKGYLYRLPLFAVFGYTIAGTALGAAQGALDALTDTLKNRTATQMNPVQNKQREQESVQMRIAESVAEVNAARALLRHDRSRINQQAGAGEFPDQDERVTYRLNLAYATKLCVSAVERLYPLAGAQGLAASNPLQRAWRDAHAVSLHVGLRWDINAINFGAVKLGLTCPDPRV
jgi:alkylation response protein AidB-like acyl-CoA dehydrogenase